MHIYNLRKNTQFHVDLRKFTWYNKTTVEIKHAIPNKKERFRLIFMSKREIKWFSSVLYFIVSCSILFVNRKHIVRRISLMMENGMFNKISRGQAAENRNARLKDKMERGEEHGRIDCFDCDNFFYYQYHQYVPWLMGQFYRNSGL